VTLLAVMRWKCTLRPEGARRIISPSTTGLPGGTRKPGRMGAVMVAGWSMAGAGKSIARGAGVRDAAACSADRSFRRGPPSPGIGWRFG